MGKLRCELVAADQQQQLGSRTEKPVLGFPPRTADDLRPLMARPPALRVSPDRQVTSSDIDCLKEAFALFDCDRDGEISVEELGKVRRCTAQSSHPPQPQPLLLSSIRLSFRKTSLWDGEKH